MKADKYSKIAYDSCNIKKISVGTRSEADLFVSNIDGDGIKRTEYTITEYNKRYKIKMKLGGHFNVYNSAMAIAAAKSLGISENISKRQEYSQSFLKRKMFLMIFLCILKTSVQSKPMKE